MLRQFISDVMLVHVLYLTDIYNCFATPCYKILQFIGQKHKPQQGGLIFIWERGRIRCQKGASEIIEEGRGSGKEGFVSHMFCYQENNAERR